MAASGCRGRTAIRAAATHTASGSPAHAVTTCRAASGSLPTRSAPIRRLSRSTASLTASAPSWTNAAPSTPSPVSRDRLVTATSVPEPPGSSGRTCAALTALSSITASRSPAVCDRHRAACSPSPAA